MAEYVQRGLKEMADALRLTVDYFHLKQDEFLRLWLPGREQELERQTTPESWQKIVEVLGNKDQRNIVADDREANVLVLAGPGSGKTRVLVHRIAYLVRVKRENPHGIVALAYNRHAAVQIRQRLHALIGNDACGVAVLTLHALAMRLVGASFAERANRSEDDFKQILLEAMVLLRGDGLLPEEADAQRDRLLAGFRWILVDEYQDIGNEEYDLISALAGRARTDDDGKINLFAVGDDDQNIYGFKGASTEFIRRFEEDYQAKPFYLIENYRSTAHIIAAANALIATASDRMKAAHPIRINRRRIKNPPGGDWQARDTVGQGRVQILPTGDSATTQAMTVMAELERLATRDANWDWASCAIIAREWKWLEPVRSYCEWKGIPVQFAREDSFYFWKLRETQLLLEWLRNSDLALVNVSKINDFFADKSNHSAWEMLREAIHDYALEVGNAELPIAHFKDWLAEWGREARRRQTGLLLVSAHSAKGLEFDHVIVLDGGWQPQKGEDMEALRRLYYVAMTRARKTLSLARLSDGNVLIDAIHESPWILHRAAMRLVTSSLEMEYRYVRPDLEKINLGFAGRHAPDDAMHTRIARLGAGATVKLHEENGGWYLSDEQGARVGKMSGKFTFPHNMRCIDARVSAILVWRKAEADTNYGEPKCEQWEVVVPEFVFVPNDGAGKMT